MIYSKELEEMCTVAKGVNHGPAPIPEEGKWVKAKEIKDISGLTHGIGWCAPQQGACKLTLNVKDGVIQEALIETIGCSGMTHSAAMAGEILTGKTILEALNTDLVCDAINTAMTLLLVLPMEVLMDHYWKKTYAKKIPEFTELVLQYYERWQNGELDMDEMKKDLWEYGGVRLEEREAE